MGVYMLWLSKVTMKNKPRHQTQREKENSQASKNSTAHNLVLSTSLNLHGFTAKKSSQLLKTENIKTTFSLIKMILFIAFTLTCFYLHTC